MIEGVIYDMRDECIKNVVKRVEACRCSSVIITACRSSFTGSFKESALYIIGHVNDKFIFGTHR